jgi:excisionase family DNA binding protein
MHAQAFVTISEAMRRLGCSRRTIYAYINAGRLKTKRTLSGGSQLVAVADLKRDPRYHEPEASR